MKNILLFLSGTQLTIGALKYAKTEKEKPDLNTLEYAEKQRSANLNIGLGVAMLTIALLLPKK
jgi:hypothetical protein